MPRTSSEHLVEAELGGKQPPPLPRLPGVSHPMSPCRTFLSFVLALALGMIIFAPACSSTTSEHTAVLPGSRLDPKPIYSREALSVAVMAPSEEPLAEELPNGNDVVCAQRFHVIQTLAAGKLQAGNRGNLPDSLRLTYLCLSGERPIARDEPIIWIADAGHASTSTGLKAWPDTPVNRQIALRVFATAIAAPRGGIGEASLLPGSRTALADALAVLPSEGPEPDRPIVARCELTQEGMGETDRLGVLDFTSKALVVQVLSGLAATGEVEIHYMVGSVVGEQEVHKGAKLIWVARIGANRKIWQATKALADTPANRRLLERCFTVNLLSVDIRKIMEVAVKIKARKMAAGGWGNESPTGLDFTAVLKDSGDAEWAAKLLANESAQEGAVKNLISLKKVWVLCALLDHRNADMRVEAARGLAELADPRTASALLAALKNNDYLGKGSEAATVHELYLDALQDALKKITGETDLGKIEAWITQRYLRPDRKGATTQPAPPKSELPAAAASLIREALQRVALRRTSLAQISPGWSMKIPVDVKTWDQAVAFADKEYTGKPATRAVFLWHFIRKDDPASRLMALNLKDTGMHGITGGGESVSYGLEMIPGKTFSIRLGNDPTPHTGSIPVATSTLNFVYVPSKDPGDMLPGDKVVDVGNLTLMHRTIDHLEFASLDFQESGPLGGFTVTRKFSNGALTVGGNISGTNNTDFYYADFTAADGNSQSIKLPPLAVPPSLKSSPRSHFPAPAP